MTDEEFRRAIRRRVLTRQSMDDLERVGEIERTGEYRRGLPVYRSTLLGAVRGMLREESAGRE